MLRPSPSPRPKLTQSHVERLRSRLDRALGPSKLVTSPDGLAAYAGDESENDPVLPDVAVIAENEDDVRTALAVALDERVPITPRAAGSGKSGGCIPVAGGIALATHGMARIVDIDEAELVAIVEPGVVLGDLHDEVERRGLFYPPDANSLSWCAIGGNIAENAGGPRAFKYGTTRDYVLGLEVAVIGG